MRTAKLTAEVAWYDGKQVIDLSRLELDAVKIYRVIEVRRFRETTDFGDYVHHHYNERKVAKGIPGAASRVRPDHHRAQRRDVGADEAAGDAQGRGLTLRIAAVAASASDAALPDQASVVAGVPTWAKLRRIDCR